MARARGDFDSTGRSASRFGGILKTVGTTAAGFVAGALFTGAISKGREFFTSASQAASDLNENISKSEAVFGKQATAINSFATAAANNLGLSRSAALAATSTFGNMFDQLDIGADQSSALSQGITTLAADFASFHNADITDVLDAQSAAFRGEFDSLQRFLPLMNAAAVEQQAMAETGKSNAKELTQQEKALATYSLMLEGAGKAQGDFARTADEAANAERRAAAEMENMRAEIGEKLLPVSVKITQIKLALARALVDKVLPALERVSAVIGPLVRQGWAKLQEVMEDLRPTIDAIVGLIGGLAGKVQDFFKSLTSGDLEEGSSQIQGIMAKLGEFRDLFVDQIVPAVVKGVERLGEIWEEIGPDVIRIVNQIVAIIVPAMDLILTAIRETIKVIEEIWRRWGDEITTVARIAWNLISGVISGALTIILGIIQTATALMQSDWSGAWDGIVTILRGAWEIIKAVLSAAWESIKATAGVALNGLKALIGSELEQIRSTVFDIFTRIKDAIGEKLEAAKAVANRILDAIASLFGLKAGEAQRATTDALQKIVDFVRGLGGKIASAAAGIFSPITDAFSGVIGTLQGMWNALTFSGKSATVTPTISSGGRSFNNAGITSSGGRSTRTPTFNNDIRRRAGGGNITGLVEVGEFGRELVDLGAGGRVISNPDTERMMAGGGGASDRFAVNDVHFHIAGSILSERELIGIVRDEFNIGGLEGAAI